MRIKINFKANNTKLPFNNQHLLNGYIHKCLGENNKYHNGKSNYNISMLCGGKLLDSETLVYKDNLYFIVSSMDSEFISKIIEGIMINPYFNGIALSNIEHIDETFYNGWNHFATLSPILIKEYKNKGEYGFLTINDPEYLSKLKKYLINKLSKINSKLDLNDFDVKCDLNKAKTKKVYIKNVLNVANVHHVSVKCNKKVAKTLYNLGIGQSTGSGFGTIYKTESKEIYKF